MSALNPIKGLLGRLGITCPFCLSLAVRPFGSLCEVFVPHGVEGIRFCLHLDVTHLRLCHIRLPGHPVHSCGSLSFIGCHPRNRQYLGGSACDKKMLQGFPLLYFFSLITARRSLSPLSHICTSVGSLLRLTYPLWITSHTGGVQTYPVPHKQLTSDLGPTHPPAVPWSVWR